jgi:hypothetical protein
VRYGLRARHPGEGQTPNPERLAGTAEADLKPLERRVGTGRHSEDTGSGAVEVVAAAKQRARKGRDTVSTGPPP